MNYLERTLSFECAGESLLGIVSMPLEKETQADTGVVIIVGGPQYRAGSHRQFVLLARALAEAGFPVLRFDYRGMGDSTGKPHTFQNVDEDIAAAIAALQTATGVRNVVLWGLCDAASAALLYCNETHDPRVAGLCLLNPWVRSEVSLARTQIRHYYTQRLMHKEFWLKLLRGKIALSALSSFVQQVRRSAAGSRSSTSEKQPFQHRMSAAWHNFSGHILLILSGDDYTAKEFLEYANGDVAWKSYLRHPKLLRHDIPGVDHTFSTAASRKCAEHLSLKWLSNLKPFAQAQTNQ